MTVYVYDAAKHYLLIGGFPIQGFQDGSNIEISFDDDVMTKQVDTDGRNVVFNKSNRYTATVTFTLNEGAAANDTLTDIFTNFRRSRGGGVVPFFFKDGNGRSLAQSAGCAVQTMPSLGGGRESTGRTWVIATAQLEMVVGGAEAAI
jgi:hypothetical protein